MLDDSLHRSRAWQENFMQIQEATAGRIRGMYACARKYGFIHATPVIENPEHTKDYKAVYEAVSNIAGRIVNAYDKDALLQQAIPLSGEAIRLISSCGKKYLHGTLRPDFLIDKKCEFRINEINARFPTNGYFISYLVNNEVSRIAEHKRAGIRRISALSRIPSYFGRLEGGITVIKDSEPNWDIALYAEMMHAKGREFSFVHPSEISVSNKRLYCKKKKLESVVLELHQWEIEKYCKPDFAQALQNHPHINDLRTIFLVHDKRFLSLLCDELVMKRYASESERAVLLPHIIETYAINRPDDLPKGIIKDKDKWVLKHALKGKKNDLHVGCSTQNEEWKKACENSGRGCFVAQKYVAQQEFSVYAPHLGVVQMPLEGMLLGIDGKFISQGAYKGDTRDKTSLWDGVVLVPPAIN